MCLQLFLQMKLKQPADDFATFFTEKNYNN